MKDIENIVLIPITIERLEEIITKCVINALAKDRETQNPRQLSLKEAAEMLGVSIPTMIKYKKDKIIPFKQLGRKIWFSFNDIKTFLKQNSSFKYKRKHENSIYTQNENVVLIKEKKSYKPKWK